MSFGATASVWAFNRMADSVMFLGRQILASPVLHYVDDYGGVEPSCTATSTFECFSDLTGLLGLKMKPKKACAPQRRLKMLGVFIECLPHEVQLQPCPERVQKLGNIMHQALETNSLSPEAAHRLAGKMVFMQTTVFGGIGKAALQVVYSRSAQHGGDHEKLTHALRSALMTLMQSLRNTRPRCLPVVGTPISVLYTDAFFALGDCGPLKPEAAPLRWKSEYALKSDHGWGYVLSVRGHTFYAFGRAPTFLLRKYCKRKAFIYFLEMLAPILVVASCHRMMTPFLVSFIDNQSGLAALSKGYGSDPAINGIIAFFWSFMGALGIFAHFEWVPSQLNISDPVSRRDVTLAEHNGWMLMDIDLTPVYEILLRCSGDLQYATGAAVTECLALDLLPSLVQGLVHSGEIGPEAVVSWAQGECALGPMSSLDPPAPSLRLKQAAALCLALQKPIHEKNATHVVVAHHVLWNMCVVMVHGNITKVPAVVWFERNFWPTLPWMPCFFLNASPDFRAFELDGGVLSPRWMCSGTHVQLGSTSTFTPVKTSSCTLPCTSEANSWEERNTCCMHNISKFDQIWTSFLIWSSGPRILQRFLGVFRLGSTAQLRAIWPDVLCHLVQHVSQPYPEPQDIDGRHRSLISPWT